jgi:hypothetical protein
MTVKTLAVLAAVALAAVAAAASAAAPPHPGSSRTPAARAAKVTRVPNEVGRNHQAAQDDLQAHGFYYLREKDCSGRGRLLLFDRNWKVVRQSPRAGAKVSTSRTITLCSIKYSD